MVKIVRRFKLLHPIEKKHPTWTKPQTMMLAIIGMASLNCKEPHPIHAGWYRLNLVNGALDISISIDSIIELATGQDLLLEFWEFPVLRDGFLKLCEDHMRKKFLNL